MAASHCHDFLTIPLVIPVQSDYQAFMHVLAQELRAAMNGGKPRKAARTDNPRASPGQVPTPTEQASNPAVL